MTKVGVKEFKTHASEIFRRVRDEGEVIDVTYRGDVIARVTPAKKFDRRRIEQVLAEHERLVAELSGGWPKGISAADAVSEDRREL
jgi:prevent-host-death family protein